MRPGARLILSGLVLVFGGVAAYVMIDWQATLGHYAHYVKPLKQVLRYTLDASWYAAFTVPILLLLGSLYAFAVAKSGRLVIVWRLFAYVTLWAIGSLAFFFALFLTYAPDMGEGGTDLLVPALLGTMGYVVIGLGFLASVLRKG